MTLALCEISCVHAGLSHWWSWSEIFCRTSLDSSDPHHRSSCCHRL